MSEYTPEREVIEEEFYRHQPVLSMKDGSIAGCQCVDRVFYRKTEDWGSHLADVHQSLLTAHDAEVRAQALEDAAAAVAEMERAFVTSEWGTVVRKLDARDMLRAKARKAKELLASWEPVESREDDRGWLSKIQVDISTRIRALATPVEPTPADVERIRDEYFETLAKLDPSPEMARIIEQAKRDLAIRKNRSSDS